MRKIRRRGSVLWTLGSIVSAVALAACGSSTGNGGGGGNTSAPKAGTPITFLDVTTLSGPSAFIGQFGTSAAYPAVKLINAAGGVLGHPVKLVLVDDKNDPADAVPALQRALSTNSNISLVLGPLTTVGPTLVPIIEAAGVTMMSVAGENEFNRPKFKYFWRYFPPDAANGVGMALWAKQHGWTRVATVFTSDAGAQGDLPGVVAGVKALHLDLVNQTTLVAGQPSYQSSVVHLLSSHPQVIFTETDPTTAATFYGELSQLNQGSIPIVGSQTTVVPTWLSVVAKAVGPAKFASEYYGVNQSSPSPTPADSIFNNALLGDASQVPKPRQWFGNPFVEANYDAVIVPALAMIAAKSTNPAVYNSFIPDVTNGGPGTTVVYSFAQGAKLLKEGKKIQYIGAHGAMHFNQYHNSFGGYVIDSYTAAGTIKPLSDISQAQIQQYVPS